MNLPITAKINKAGHLEIGGCDAAALAKEFGTPLYVLDEKDIRSQCQAYKTLFKSKYPNSDIVYASKALSAVGLLKVIADEGLGVDVSSGGELYTALKAGFAPRKIYFHGNNKSTHEIREGLSVSAGRFVIDNFDEIENLDKISVKMGRKARVLIRINPGVAAHTHEAVRTGQTDSKFGISKVMVLDAVKMVNGTRNLSFVGLHAHIGSQIFDVNGYLAEIDVLTKAAKEITERLGAEVEEINIGGGIGIAYVEGECPAKIEDFAKAITKRLKEKVAEYKLRMPKLVLEPGRSIVGRAGITLYTIGHIKEIPGIRKYVVVDGGMADNPRPMLYGAKYDLIAADNMKAARTEKATIAGRFCESGDVLVKDIKLPKLKKGGVLAALCTGAYNYSMASNYNRVPRPAMILVNDGKAKPIVKRESYKDITNCDII